MSVRRALPWVLACGWLLLATATAHAAAPRSTYSVDGTADGPGTVGLFSSAVPGGALAPLAPPQVETGGNPQHAAVTADGRRAYVSAAGPGLLRSYRVRRADGTLRALGEPASAAGGVHGVVVAPGDESVYAASQDAAAVFQYDIAPDGTLAPKEPASVPSGAGASGVAVAPDASAAYVTNLNDASVSQFRVDAASGALVPMEPAHVPAPPLPGGIGVSPSGNAVYVATLSGRVAQYEVTVSGRLRPMDPATLPVGSGSAGIATTPDGRFLYTPDGGTDGVSQFAVDRATGELTPLEPAAIPAGDRPEGAAVTPDGRGLYVANAGDATVSWLEIDPRTGALSPGEPPAVPTGPEPHGLVVTPDQGPRAKFRRDRVARVGERVRFDAGGSRDRDGDIARFVWTFGDGSRDRDGGVAPAHRYEEPGRYRVRLRVVDDERCSARFLYTGATASCNGGPEAVAERRVRIRP